MSSPNLSSSLQTKKQKVSMGTVVAPDGTRIAYQRSGLGPPLILVHGSLDDHRTWMHLLPAFAQDFTVYALDRRGRGESGATNAATYTLEREFEDLAAVLSSIDEPAYLLGHSYGAICALEVALRTGSVRKLILYEPPIPIPPGRPISLPGALAEMEKRLEKGDRDGVASAFVRKVAQVSEAEIAAARSSPAWQVAIAVAHTLPYEVRAVENYVFDPGRFNGLKTPTLLMVGSESPPYLKSATEALAAALPDNRLTVLEAQGHLAMHTNPELFMHEVVQFLSES